MYVRIIHQCFYLYHSPILIAAHIRVCLSASVYGGVRAYSCMHKHARVCVCVYVCVCVCLCDCVDCKYMLNDIVNVVYSCYCFVSFIKICGLGWVEGSYVLILNVLRYQCYYILLVF